MLLKYKLFIILSAIGMIPFFIIGVLCYSYAREILTEEAFSRISSLRSSKVEQVEEYLLFDKEKLQLVSSKTQMRQLVDDYIKENDPEDLVKLNRILADTKKSVENITEILITNAQGYVIASTNTALIGQSKTEERFFVNGKLQESVDIFSRDQNSRLAHYLSGPIIYNNTPVGVVVIKTDAAHYLRLFTDYDELGATGETIFVLREPSGPVYAHPLRFDNDAAFKRKADLSGMSEPVTRSHSRQTGAFSDVIDYRGIPVFSSTHYFKELDAQLTVKIDKSEILAPVEQFKSTFFVISLLILVVIIIIVILLTHAITRPIVKLLSAVDRVSHGDFTTAAAIDVESNDEIGKLADAFKNMTLRLERSYGLLEKKVIERTEELANAKHVADERASEAERLSNLMVGREIKMVELKREIDELRKQR